MADIDQRVKERDAVQGDREQEASVRRDRCRAAMHCAHAPMSHESVMVPKLPRLWYENSNGERWIPPKEYNGSEPPPEGFIYQHSRFPGQLNESVLRLVQVDEVAACEHPNDRIHPTYGWIEGVEGRECRDCAGSQMRELPEAWPDVWDASGSRQIMTGSSGWSKDMATELVKHSVPIDDAILFCAVSCEKCMNIALWALGLPDGYPADSEEAERAGTSCEICTDGNEDI